MLEDFKTDDPKYTGNPMWLKDAVVGREYWICDSVIGRIDEDLIEVRRKIDNDVEVYNLLTDKIYALPGDRVVAHENSYVGD